MWNLKVNNRLMIMKQLLKEFGLQGLTLKQKAIVIYFLISFCLIGSVVEAPAWGLILLVLNFANSARLLKQVPLPELDEGK
ncbi:MAG: hypothetical protein EZS26_000782 [Candidatus Ordinivivax streblomastigis]|uniref:Uncharacterized protein n=1 Tax=Candidatus Ordinivivax streblomastigis TaxID=2540710 RepID=A0A5M8P3W7_9BACT|nr:MAG: hypothetical protein EZS26_000782 [Candidatus Ordinivivax streblomastigis]